jgi:biotin synthase
MIASARILMPRPTVRTPTGRHLMSSSDQALGFLAGATTIFTSEDGDLFVTASPRHEADVGMLTVLGSLPDGRSRRNHVPR